MKRHRRTITVGMLLLLGACSTVPMQRVETYTQAFDEASAAGNQLYDGISAKVIEETAVADRSGTPSATDGQVADGTIDPSQIVPAAGPACDPANDPTKPFPDCFDPRVFLQESTSAEPDSLMARRQALATITTFNAVALRLASGETAEQLGAEVQRLGSNASSLAALSGAGAAFAPVAGITTDLAAQLAVWAETLRADQQLRATLKEGGPLIQQLIAALIADTPTMYALKREEVAAQADVLQQEANEVQFDIMDMLRPNAAPEVAMVSALAERDMRYNNARLHMGKQFQALASLVQGSQPITQNTLSRIDGEIAKLETIAGAYQAQIGELNRYYEALGDYVVMLHDVNDSLVAVTASARIQTVTVDPASLALEATKIRDQAREIQRLLDA
ncbi:MAG: hypothetical protein AAF637_06480 [Pseudomonadota bacterium]